MYLCIICLNSNGNKTSCKTLRKEAQILLTSSRHEMIKIQLSGQLNRRRLYYQRDIYIDALAPRARQQRDACARYEHGGLKGDIAYKIINYWRCALVFLPSHAKPLRRYETSHEIYDAKVGCPFDASTSASRISAQDSTARVFWMKRIECTHIV